MTKQYVDDQIHLQTNKIFDERTDSFDLHPNFTYVKRDFGNDFNLVDLVIPNSQADSFMKDHQHSKVYQIKFNIFIIIFLSNVLECLTII